MISHPLAELISYLDTLPEPHILCDRDYRILAANKAYRRNYGGGHAIVGQTCYAVSHRYPAPCDKAGETCPLKQSLASGQRERVLHLHHTPEGEAYVNIELAPVRNAQGEIAYFVEKMETLGVSQGLPDARALVGRAPAFRRMLELVARVAPSDATVMLQGESGTGKELVAKAIHDASRRASRPFVAVDCSGLTETLFESELFGHEKGSFTGAASRRIGLVEAASGGTLFLDELGDIPLGLQVKLLRLLETGTFRRVGASDFLKADVRLISATHRNLRAMISEGRFRQDLYYRLNTFPIHLPALRERIEDVPLLVEALLARVAPGRSLHLSEEALACLMAYDYPGNVRELRNVLERATLLCDGDVILPEHLPPELIHGGDPATRSGGPVVVARTLEDIEDEALRRRLAAHHGNRKSLAAELGISERTLYRRLQRIREKNEIGSVT
ncbi:sigma-54 interaction domain-containing protein [Sulfuricystis multivorans]|uniref:sigma-54 interaction domain-containing protein n=1 Tax=Sulfuricystis multivorans TaxID=2211108 RepID=UPI000F81EFBA|nr:sigma-54-dependent Fis family transcriptional regulator [Sulfuricystis multivorans]